jgi:undecaprenyl-diphosphatase
LCRPATKQRHLQKISAFSVHRAGEYGILKEKQSKQLLFIQEKPLQCGVLTNIGREYTTLIEILKAALMGVIEGITEWLPISSTGHMILAEQLIHFNASEEFVSMFRVVIQLGAIMAVVVLFWNKLWPFTVRRGRIAPKKDSWVLWFKIVVATLPVLIISPLDDWMEEHFYNYMTVAAMLILYGVLFIVVENRRARPNVTRLDQISFKEAFLVGVWQMLAIIPGTSRSGATIVGGLLLGLSRACVAEFTFFLAIPVMAGASLLKVVKFALAGIAMTSTEISILVTGCLVAFLVSLASIRFLMNYVKRHDFKFFGVYRILLGIVVLVIACVNAIW